MIVMIIDLLKNAKRYYGLGQRFRKAFIWLETVDFSTLTPEQRICIDGEDIYATLYEYETCDPASIQLESHCRYVDIQYTISGKESFGYVLEGPVQACTEYNQEKDFQFFSGIRDSVTAMPGSFYLLWPEDLHAPRCICRGQKDFVRRVVVKVKL